MRLVVLALVIALLLAYIAVAIRPHYRRLSDVMLGVCGVIMFLIVGGFAGWFMLGN